MMKKLLTSPVAWAALAVVSIAAVLTVFSHGPNQNEAQKLQVVAGENFWGSLVSQLGGSKVQVTSVVSDPNADPHEYESNTATAQKFTQANYVILNGAGYDSWGQKLLNASPNGARKTLTVADLIGKKNGDNPHFWYNPSYVNAVAVQMDKDLIALRPGDAGYFREQLKTLQASLAEYQGRVATIKQQFGGTKVAATEDIFQYLADAAGLNLISPPQFIEAVAEGNDPTAQSIATFQQQLESKEPVMLVFNKQTVTPLTDSVKKLASDQGIPVIGVTETIQPPTMSFQGWMNAQLITLENALSASKLGQ